MAVTLESAQRLTALKNKIDGVTNIESGTLAEAIDNALAGYGQGEGDTTNEDGLVTHTLTEYQNDRVTSIGEYLFSGCSSLTSVTFPLVKSIGRFAFSDCSSLTSVTLPLVESIRTGAFSGCSSLTSVTFPLVYVIDYRLFYNCSSLTSVDLSSATTMEGGVFYNCTSLKSLILRSKFTCNMPDESSLTNTSIASGTGYIYVPSALVDTYKTATNWSRYADQFRALEDYTVDGTTTGALDETKIGASGESGA